MEQSESFADQVDYQSNHSSEADSSASDSENSITAGAEHAPAVPPRKRKKLDIPFREQREQKRAQHQIRQQEEAEEMARALVDLEKLLKSKKTKFVGGDQGLQAQRTHAMASHLKMVVCSGPMQPCSAETHGFAAKWGGRQLCKWSRHWLRDRDLPKSLRGQHAKVYSLLSDPTVAAELRAYVRSNKWAMDPAKLAQFVGNKLIDTAADKYLRHIIDEEMPRGLKWYMEIELFPRIHLKVGRGISLSTAHCWLHGKGFRYISHKKGLYFDGHDWPDVLAYWQNEFLPTMKVLEPRLV